MDKKQSLSLPPSPPLPPPLHLVEAQMTRNQTCNNAVEEEFLQLNDSLNCDLGWER